jgi:hypothetical protein
MHVGGHCYLHVAAAISEADRQAESELSLLLELITVMMSEV